MPNKPRGRAQAGCGPREAAEHKQAAGYSDSATDYANGSGYGSDNATCCGYVSGSGYRSGSTTGGGCASGSSYGSGGATGRDYASGSGYESGNADGMLKRPRGQAQAGRGPMEAAKHKQAARYTGIVTYTQCSGADSG